MKTFFDGENGMSVKKSLCGEQIDINVIFKLRKTRPRRQKANHYRVPCVFSRLVASPPIVMFLCVSCNPRSNRGTILAVSLYFKNILKITIYNWKVRIIWALVFNFVKHIKQCISCEKFKNTRSLQQFPVLSVLPELQNTVEGTFFNKLNMAP